MPTTAPVRIAFLTSIRDIGADDQVGQMVPTRDGSRYMEGVIERTTKESLPGGKLHGLVEVVSIITDDRLKDLVGSGYTSEPCGWAKWIFPLGLPSDERGNKATDLVVNIPSDFRSIPKCDASLKREAKRAFEVKVLRIMKETGATTIVSDHYMAKIVHLIGEFGLYSRVLNIHPAVTCLDSPFCVRGPTPTKDVLELAKKQPMRTGATLHVVNEKFDDGPIIKWAAPTPVYASDEPRALRWRNYQLAKLPVFVEGMQKYATEMFPRL